MYSNGVLKLRKFVATSSGGDPNAEVVLGTRSKVALGMFSNIVTDDYYNYGLPEFDICVNQYDNYSDRLDKYGNLVDITEF